MRRCLRGTHCWINQPQHSDWSQDREYYSYKYNKAGINYELGIAISSSDLIWMSGPFKAGQSDKRIVNKNGLKNRNSRNLERRQSATKETMATMKSSARTTPTILAASKSISQEPSNATKRSMARQSASRPLMDVFVTERKSLQLVSKRFAFYVSINWKAANHWLMC